MHAFRKKFLHFIALFHTIALPVIFAFFVVFFVREIPLIYLLPFFVIYIVTRGISFFFDHDRSVEVLPDVHIPHIFVILGVNIIVLILITSLITRYELSEYRYVLYGGTLVFINSIYAEHSTHIFSRWWKKWIENIFGLWIVRTVLLFSVVGGVTALYNTFSLEEAPVLPTKPRISQSEVTGILSTRAPLEEEVLSGSSQTWIIGNSQKENQTPPSPLKKIENISSREATGSLTTASSVRVESITSEDGRATAKIEDGKLRVEVIAPTPLTTTGTEWTISTSVKSAWGGGGLHGIVISAPIARPVGSTYPTPQPITLLSEGSSGIFFTLDGSEPSCDGKWLTTAKSRDKKIIITAISCFGNNRIRWPISRHVYSN